MQRFYTGTVTSEKYGHALDRMADLFRDMDAENAALREQVPRWVPVSERLPELGQSVLVSVVFDGIRYIDRDKWAGPNLAGGWMDYPAEQVTHWMPLPPPPAEEG